MIRITMTCAVMMILIITPCSATTHTPPDFIQSMPEFSLSDLADSLHSAAHHIKSQSEKDNDDNTNDMNPRDYDVSFLEVTADAAFIRYVRKSYFFLLMFFPNLVRLVRYHKMLVDLKRPPPNDPPVIPQIYLEISSNTTLPRDFDPRSLVDHLDSLQPSLLRVHSGIVSLIEVGTLRRRDRTPYGWLCRVLVWIYRWFRWYGQVINRNLLQVRYWLTEVNDRPNFAFRPQLSGRWSRFIQCGGRLECLAPNEPTKKPYHPTATQTSANGFASDGDQGVIAVADEENNDTGTGLNFEDCDKYEDCKEEADSGLVFRDLNATKSDYNITNAFNDAMKNMPKIPTSFNQAAVTESAKSEPSSGLLPESEVEDIEEKLPARDMEHQLVNQLNVADHEIQLFLDTKSIKSLPPHHELDEAENDGLGEAQHLLQGLPEDVWTDLPSVMRKEEENSDGSKEPITELQAVSIVSEADLHQEKIRPK